MRSLLIYPSNVLTKYCTNAETNSFANIYVIPVLDEGNYHSLPALL